MANPKAPTPPPVAPVEEVVPAAPLVHTNPVKQFWEIIQELKLFIADKPYGVQAWTNAPTLKDSKMLNADVDKFLMSKNVHLDVHAKDVKTTQCRIEGTKASPTEKIGFLTSGTYTARWILGDDLVYQSDYEGAFEDVSSVKAVHGALTCAKTDIYFTISKAVAITEEDMLKSQVQQGNMQDPRTPATTSGLAYD